MAGMWCGDKWIKRLICWFGLELEEEYLQAIHNDLPELIKQMLNDTWDTTSTTVVLAALAVAKGQIKIADAILKMEDENILDEFLTNY